LLRKGATTGAQEHFLSIRLAGQSISSARIPANHLI
jgi:hypothetical protein